MDPDRLSRVLARIDQLNSEDPNTELVNGLPTPRELAYAQRLTDWVLRLNPNASETLRIAARGQHVQRWTVPRERYERNRRGYLRWREVLKAFHAKTMTEIMQQEGYPDEMVQRVQQIILKKSLATDPEAQTIEDGLCLVFLETQFADLRRKEPEEKMIDILRKSWQKMSEKARAAALQLPLGDEERQLLERALRAD
jgi:hypothetical protein